MSGHIKHVRFAPQNIFYPPETFISAIALSSPTDSFSSSSTNSSGSKTARFPGPTPYLFLGTPPQRPFKPADRHGCHPLLESSAITYDLRDPISSATITHTHHRLSIETLRQSAFVPSLSHIAITSSYLPWTIKVHASNAPYITLQDVLSSLYSAFRTNITKN